MAQKNLSIKLTLNDKQFMTGLRKASSSMKRFGNSMQKTGKSLSRNLTLPILAFGAASVKAFDKQQKALAQVEAGLKSTGNAAGFTSDQLQKMASDLQGKTIFGDEVILKDATAQLLTFTNISGEQFARTQEAALDLATRLDGDLKSASIQLGKALNDPVANLSALSRSGIQFSEEQKATIKSLAETNRLADAQTLILDELNKQYGGSAEAAAQAGIGGIQQLQNSLGDLAEEFGKIISDNIGPFVEKIKGLVGFLRGLTDEQKKTIVQVAGFAAALGPAIFLVGKIVTAVGGLIKIIRVLGAVMAANPIGLIATAIAGLVAGIIYLATSSSETAVKIRNFFRKMANGVIEVLNEMIKGLNKVPLVNIDLIEGLYLLEKGIINVYNIDNQLQFNELKDHARGIYDNFDLNYMVYKDLREHGYVVLPGIKFGCEYAIYEHGPGIDHSPYMVSVRAPGDKMTSTDIVRAGRLATSVRKRFIIALPNPETDQINYIMFKWFKA